MVVARKRQPTDRRGQNERNDLLVRISGQRWNAPEQRQAAVANLRQQQRQAAEAARQSVLDDEHAAARVRRA